MSLESILLIALIVLIALWAFRRIGRTTSFLARFCIYLVIFVSPILAEEDPFLIDPIDFPPIIDPGIAPIDQPIVFGDLMSRAAPSILAWMEQDCWSGPGWLNETVNLTKNVTKNMTA